MSFMCRACVLGVEFFHSNGSNFLLVFETEAERDVVYDKITQRLDAFAAAAVSAPSGE